MATKKKPHASSPIEVEHQKLRAAHARALATLRAAIVKLAKNETDVASVRRLVDRCYKTERMAYATYQNRQEAEEAGTASQIEELTRTIAAASESGQRVGEIQRKAHLAELDAAIDTQHTRYVPGVGYVRGRRVIA
jgi:hypothetical protein